MTNLEKIIGEYSRMKARKERTLNGVCATCGRTEDHNGITEFGEFTHQFDIGVDARMWNEIDFLRQALNQIRQKTLEEIGNLPRFDVYDGGEAETEDGDYINVSDFIRLIQSKKENI